MKRAISLLGMLVCILAPSLAYSVDGNTWIKLPEDVQVGYLGGLWDGWSYVLSEGMAYLKKYPDATPGAVETGLAEVLNCHKGKPYTQLNAIVEKYMKDHPAIWHYSMPSLAFVAIKEACVK